jgi:predicted DNA-binding transcriptional regulator AlpA
MTGRKFKRNVVVRARARRSPQSKPGQENREPRWMPGVRLRKNLGISSVTLWRWRHRNGFPNGKRINGRLYFPWEEVESWLEAQIDAA